MWKGVTFLKLWGNTKVKMLLHKAKHLEVCVLVGVCACAYVCVHTLIGVCV